MSSLNELRDGQYSIAPTAMMRNRHPHDQLMLVWLWHHANRSTDQCFPSVRTLAKEAGISKTSVSDALKRLEEAGMITKKQRRKDGDTKALTSNLYTVLVVQVGDPATTSEGGSTAQCVTPERPVVSNKNQENKNQETITTEQAEEDTSAEAVKINFGDIKALWNQICQRSAIPQIRDMSEGRKKKIRTRMKKNPDFVDVLKDQLANLSDFAKGDNKYKWTVKFDWLVGNDDNWTKFAEGNYRKASTPAQPTTITSPDGKTYRR